MTDDGWLGRFHDGDRAVMADCYRDHYDTVDRSVGRVLAGADRETVVHEVFYRLLSSRETRENFTGGSLDAWLATVARNLAIDQVRAHRTEEVVAPDEAIRLAEKSEGCDTAAATEAHLIVEEFRREWLPPEWDRLFVLRYLERRSQREAARALGVHQTTLAYRDLRIRRLLRRFLLGRGAKP